MPPSTAQLTLPDPNPDSPVVTRVISDSPLLESSQVPVVVWIVSRPHPLESRMKIVRMFIGDGEVEIYAASDDGKTCTRNRLPMRMVRLIEEGMPPDMFVEEIDSAEYDEPPPGPGLPPEEPEDDPPPTHPQVAPTNQSPS